MKGRNLAKLVAAVLLISQCSVVFAAEKTDSKNSPTHIEESSIASEESLNIDKLNNSLSTEAYVAIDSKTGEKIVGHNEDKVMYPASLTKVMTSLLLLESGKLDSSFPVSKEADEIGEASIYATEGEELSGRDLLYAMMLQSANDACYVVAEGISGNVNDFYTLMTNRAKELGAKVSNFNSSNGLHNEEHVSSAMDLALITREALKYDEFRTAIKEKEFELTRTSEVGMKSIVNKNRMLFKDKPEYNETSIGGKTAYTTPAGNCLMEVATKDGMEIIVITLKSKDVYEDTSKIIDYVFDNYKSIPIYSNEKITYDYKDTILNLYSKESVGYLINAEDATPSVSTDVKLSKDAFDIISVDEKIGVLNTYVDGDLYKSVDLYSAEDYDFTITSSIGFIKNIALFCFALILIKIALNIIKIRKMKTQGYLKNSNFY